MKILQSESTQTAYTFQKKTEELHEKATDKKINWKLGYLKYEGEKEIDLTGLNKGLTATRSGDSPKK